LAAKPDPVAAFSAPVCGHMNGDHEQDMKDMVKHYVGLTVATVRMLDVDRLGTNMQCTTETNPEPFKLRLPFIRCVLLGRFGSWGLGSWGLGYRGLGSG
jgi:hypothetical protein